MGACLVRHPSKVTCFRLLTTRRGAVIINDVTARERQRDHKQFYIGKSLDTFCPMVRCLPLLPKHNT